jgi:hypothetical protein
LPIYHSQPGRPRRVNAGIACPTQAPYGGRGIATAPLRAPVSSIIAFSRSNLPTNTSLSSLTGGVLKSPLKSDAGPGKMEASCGPLPREHERSDRR